MLMEVRELRYFLAVAREENITRAAESMHIPQPTITKQLMDMKMKGSYFSPRRKESNMG